MFSLMAIRKSKSGGSRSISRCTASPTETIEARKFLRQGIERIAHQIVDGQPEATIVGDRLDAWHRSGFPCRLQRTGGAAEDVCLLLALAAMCGRGLIGSSRLVHCGHDCLLIPLG